jgi:hypothetical protein
MVQLVGFAAIVGGSWLVLVGARGMRRARERLRLE